MRRFLILASIAILSGAGLAQADDTHAVARSDTRAVGAGGGFERHAAPSTVIPAPFPSTVIPILDEDDSATARIFGYGVREALTINEAIAYGAPARTDEQLDTLFARLADAQDATEARGVVGLINRHWMRSGSATADLLMTRAREAMREQDHALAVELLDRIIALQPDWAEAWNRRSVAFHRLGDPLAAMADIHRTVSLEPRHFGAWAGLGHILRDSGDEAAALASYEHALSIHPYLPRLEPIVEKLRRDLYGIDL